MAIYLLIIQYHTRLGGKVSVKLINREVNESVEYRANSLIYKVFWTFMDGSLPYLKYSYRKFRARKKKRSEGGPSTEKIQIASRVEKEYFKPTYSASIGVELEDGLFDEQYNGHKNNCFKAIGHTAKAFSSCCYNNWSLAKHMAVTSICTNSALLVCLYDKEGKWKMEPRLAAILIMEHILLLHKFGLSRLVPEEPAWVRANRVKNVTQAQDVYSKQLLRSNSGEFVAMVKPEQEQQFW
ncbi:hypothetical protein Bca4012_056765 [Brassica carinata]